MEIVVCIKQVPDTVDVKIDPVTKNLVREGITGVINPFDKNALEEAIRLKEKQGAKVTVISMGPPQFKESLREALAMGADEAVLLCDRAFAGADTLATAYVLNQAIKKIGQPDIVFFGKHAVDADTGQVGPIVAEMLGLVQATYVTKVTVEEDKIQVERLLEDSKESLELKLPAVLTVAKELNEPRYPTPLKIMKAARKEIAGWGKEDLGADPAQIGMRGSPTQVLDIFSPQRSKEVKMLSGTLEEIAQDLFNHLRADKVL